MILPPCEECRTVNLYVILVCVCVPTVEFRNTTFLISNKNSNIVSNLLLKYTRPWIHGTVLACFAEIILLLLLRTEERYVPRERERERE